MSDDLLDYFGRFGYNVVEKHSQVGGGIDMSITATELKANLGKYLLLAASNVINLAIELARSRGKGRVHSETGALVP